jgi:plasmid stability protein
MATVQIRNLDNHAYDVLRRRAAESGRSLQEYLRITLEKAAAAPTMDEVLARARERLVSEVTMDDVVAVQREGRAR